MAARKGFRFWARSVFNVPRWVGWDDLRRNAANISTLCRHLFRYKASVAYRESFEEAVARMGLSEEDIMGLARAFQRRAWLFLTVFFLSLLYHAVLIYYHRWEAAIVMLSIDFMVWAFWFREHFWYTQIKQRRLGLSFKEWLWLWCC